MPADFTDEELFAYADECLLPERCVVIEQSLRQDQTLVERLATLLSERDQGEHSLGQLWRRNRLSCPSRAVWAAYVDGRLGDGLTQYLQFHLETVGCRVCAANFADLSHRDQSTENERRTRKIFQSSAGTLRNADDEKRGGPIK
jgi:anti-sigma factor RsiW